MVIVINTKPDKFLIQCIELDLYDILYKANTNGWDEQKAVNKTEELLLNYKSTGAIKRFGIIYFTRTNGVYDGVSVEVQANKKFVVDCKVP